MKENAIYQKENRWGTHKVTAGFGRLQGKFIASSRGWGGAKGYFKIFDTLEAAQAHVDRETAPIENDVSPEERLSWF